MIVEFNRRAGGRDRGQGPRSGDPRPGRRPRPGRSRPAPLLGRRDRRSEGPIVVGQTAITREWSDWRNGWIWWLQSVYIDAEFRGQGIFRALYRHISGPALAEPDVIGMRLYVENGNLRAQQTYQALGMKPGGYSVLEELWLRSLPTRLRPPGPHQSANACSSPHEENA